MPNGPQISSLESAPALQSNRAARLRVAAFPGGQVAPRDIPFAGAPGPRYAGEQVIVKAGMGRGPTMQPAGLPASAVTAPLGTATIRTPGRAMPGDRMRPGGFGGGGTSPRAQPEARNAQRASEMNGGALAALPGKPKMWLWGAAALAALLLLRRK